MALVSFLRSVLPGIALILIFGIIWNNFNLLTAFLTLFPPIILLFVGSSISLISNDPPFRTLRLLFILIGLPWVYWLSVLMLDGLLTRYPLVSLPLAYCCSVLLHISIWWHWAPSEDKKRGWVFVHRWNYGLVLLGVAVAGMLLILYEFHSHYVRNYNPDRFPWALSVPLVGAPVALFLWHIRDKIKEKDQEQRDLDRLQVDFHKYSEWAVSSEDIALRTVALNNIKPFITGEVFGSPRANGFQVPGLSLLITLMKMGKDGEKREIEEQEEKAVENQEKGPEPQTPVDKLNRIIFPQVERVFKQVLSNEYKEPLATVLKSSSFRGLAEEGKAFFSFTYLKGANLRGADLEGADLERAMLMGADLIGVKLRCANLLGSKLQKANLLDANLHNAILTAAKLQKANLHVAQLDGVKLQAADLQGANMKKVHLGGADLHGANLNGANLQGASMLETNLREANLLNIQNWREIRFYRDTDITGVKNSPDGFMEWALGKGAVIDKNFYKEANQREANLAGVYLRGFVLQGAKLQGANLKNIRYWREIKSIEGANITDVKNAPDGFVEWALERGAVIDEDGDKP